MLPLSKLWQKGLLRKKYKKRAKPVFLYFSCNNLQCRICILQKFSIGTPIFPQITPLLAFTPTSAYFPERTVFATSFCLIFFLPKPFPSIGISYFFYTVLHNIAATVFIQNIKITRIHASICLYNKLPNIPHWFGTRSVSINKILSKSEILLYSPFL